MIVPVYNSSEQLKLCLAALSESNFEDFTVLVVDDGSIEPIRKIVDSYEFDYIRIEGPGGPARARNRGAALVESPYLVFIDADVCVHRGTLSRIAERFAEAPDLDALIGSYDEAPAEPGLISQYKNLFHHYVHQQNDGDITTFWSGCGAIRRDLFLEFGGFDEERYRRPAIEDIELGTWLSAAGRRVILDRRVKVKHLKRWTFWGMLKTDIFDRGVPWTRLMLRAGAVANTLNVENSQRLSVVMVYLSAASVVAAFWWSPSTLIGAALATAVTALNWDFYRYFAARRGAWFTLRILPLHWLYFAYCGFCVVWGTLLHALKDRHERATKPLKASCQSLEAGTLRTWKE